MTTDLERAIGVAKEMVNAGERTWNKYPPSWKSMIAVSKALLSSVQDCARIASERACLEIDCKTLRAEVERVKRDRDDTNRVVDNLIMQLEKADTLLKKVDDYYRGNKPFNFSNLSDQERSNQAWDAWQGIHSEMKAYFAEKEKKGE